MNNELGLILKEYMNKNLINYYYSPIFYNNTDNIKI